MGCATRRTCSARRAIRAHLRRLPTPHPAHLSGHHHAMATEEVERLLQLLLAQVGGRGPLHLVHWPGPAPVGHHPAPHLRHTQLPLQGVRAGADAGQLPAAGLAAAPAAGAPVSAATRRGLSCRSGCLPPFPSFTARPCPPFHPAMPPAPPAWSPQARVWRVTAAAERGGARLPRPAAASRPAQVRFFVAAEGTPAQQGPEGGRASVAAPVQSSSRAQRPPPPH